MKQKLKKIWYHIYDNFIYEDFSVLTTFGKIFISPFWLMRMVLYTLMSPILSIDYFWKNSDYYNIIMLIYNKIQSDINLMINELKNK